MGQTENITPDRTGSTPGVFLPTLNTEYASFYYTIETAQATIFLHVIFSRYLSNLVFSLFIIKRHLCMLIKKHPMIVTSCSLSVVLDKAHFKIVPLSVGE